MHRFPSLLFQGALGLLVCLGLCLPGSEARAQCVSVNAFQIFEVTTGQPKALSTTDLEKYFNMARCQCGASGHHKINITVMLTGSPASCTSERLAILAGSNCYNDSTKIFDTTNCTVLLGAGSAGDVAGVLLKGYQGTSLDVVNIPTNKFMGGTCTASDISTSSITAYTSDTSGGNWTAGTTLSFNTDTQGPAAPKSAIAVAGENLVEVTFTSHTASATSTDDSGATGITTDSYFKSYQVLCEEVDASGNSVGPGLAAPPTADYLAAINLCGSTSTPDAGTPDTGSPDASTADAGMGLGWPKPLAAEAGVPDAKPADLKPPDAIPLDAKTIDGPPLDAKAVDATPSDAKPADNGSPDAGVDASTSAPSGGLAAYNQAYVCSAKVSAPGPVRITGLKNRVTYNFYVITIDTMGNPSDMTSAGSATPIPEEDLWERYKRSKGKATGGYCFVATAAYGSYDHPHVRVLREFRDQVLLRSGWGRTFVQSYYLLSPGPANWLARHNSARAAARLGLWPVTLFAGGWLYTSSAQKGLLLLGAALMLWLLAKRRTRQRARGGQS